MESGEAGNAAKPTAVVLDGMGVIFDAGRDGDDVENLLIPFVRENGGSQDEDVIRRTYVLASEGKMSALQFWQKMSVDPALEDQYLERFNLIPGVIGFLDEAARRGIPVWGLSNDVSEWSRKLRARFGLDKQMKGFLVSGDAMVRKPESAIFKYMLRVAQSQADELLLVDDGAANLNAAAAVGYATALFDPADGNVPGISHRIIRGFDDLLQLI